MQTYNIATQGRSYGLDSGQAKIFARVAREKFLGVMNINELIIVKNWSRSSTENFYDHIEMFL